MYIELIIYIYCLYIYIIIHHAPIEHPAKTRLRFGPGVHDAACSTCCLVRRGAASLEAVLAMLQLLLDSGEAGPSAANGKH